MKFLVKTMAALQQEEMLLKQLYSSLANRPNTNVATTIPINLDPNTTNTTNNDQEFNYKMVYYYTFFMLMDRFKSIGCGIRAETPA